MNEKVAKQALFAIRKAPNSSEILKILNIMSYFASKNIEAKMFLCLVDDEKVLADAIHFLKQYSIVDSDKEESVLSIQPEVQQIIRTNLVRQKKEKEVLKKALVSLSKNAMNSNNLDHAITVWSHAIKYREIIVESSRLPSHIVNELMICVRYEEANEFGRKALDLLKRRIGESHPDSLALQHYVASLLGVQGKYNESLEMLSSLLEKDVELSGNITALDTLFLIAKQLCALSRYDEALSIYRSYFSHRKVSETRDISVLSAWHDYALLLCDLGEYCQSLEILRDIFRKRCEVLGVDNESTISVKSSIGHIFVKQSNYLLAMEAFREVVDKRMAVLGEYHINTLRALDDIALVLIGLNKYDEALEIYEVVAYKFVQILGKEHPDTLATQANLATTFHNKGDCLKALEIYKHVCKIQSETLGPEHYETLRVKRNIALIFDKQGKYNEALSIFAEVYQGYIKIFGSEHPETVEVGETILVLKMMPYDTTHSTAKVGNLNKIRSFIQNGADINEKDGNKNTPLHYAVQYGHINVIRLLLESGAIYNTRNKECKIPLQLTTNIAITNLLNLVEKLFQDVKVGSHKQIAAIIMKEKKMINVKEDGGFSALHWAVNNGHSRIVTLLLESGAEATQVTNNGNTPLHIAISKGHKEIIEVLLQHVSNNILNDFMNAKTAAGGNASLHVAVTNGSLDITMSLLKRGAIYNIKNNEGKTPLDLSKDQTVIDLLKQVEELFIDTKNGNVEKISKLQAVNIEEFTVLINARNNQGSTLMQVALNNGHKNIESKLLEICDNKFRKLTLKL